MKHADRVLAFAMGAMVAVVAMFAIENFRSKPSADYATSKDVQELRARVIGLDTALRESEKRIQAEVEKNRLALERRTAEEAARRLGDMAKLRQAHEAAKRAEAEARKQADVVKQREVAAEKARENARIAARAAAEKAWSEQNAKARFERERIASAEAETLYQQATAMESGGNARDAIRIYRRAARGGSGKAAKRLGDLFDCGVPGVSRDYAESLQWYETARQLGEDIPTAGRRDACPIAAQ